MHQLASYKNRLLKPIIDLQDHQGGEKNGI
jgi:hypothetical protein